MKLLHYSSHLPLLDTHLDRLGMTLGFHQYFVFLEIQYFPEIKITYFEKYYISAKLKSKICRHFSICETLN